MSIFSRLFPKNKQTAEAGYYPLAVLYATAPDGLSAPHGFALREAIIAASPVYLTFLNPGSFLVCFPGTEAGNQSAEKLANTLREYANCNNISPFGVATRCGPCLIEWDGEGPFNSHPIGAIISDTMKSACQLATDAL